MYVEIKAADGVNDSRGKRSWVNLNDYQISISHSSPDHLNNPSWHIEVRGKQGRQSGGSHGGDFKYHDYKMEIDLTPSDIARLIEFAMLNGLVSLVPATRIP